MITVLKDVSITVTDGQLATASGEGVHVKIGVSPVSTTEPLVIKGSYGAKRIQSILGLSPLADACMDSVENGAGLIYCIPVKASTDGSVGTVAKITADETGTGAMTITGKPNNRYSIRVRITKAGGFNEAALQYSFDGGITYSDDVTMPLDGSLSVDPTGLKFVFTEGEGPVKFTAGDVFTATTTAPQMSNESVLAALSSVRKITQTIEFIHIVGESNKALWASLAVEADNFFSKYFKPIFFVLEARAPTDDESTEQYVNALIEERKTVNSYFLQVVAARGSYLRMDGTTQSINLAGLVCGLYPQAAVQQSISETRSFSISKDKLIRLEPEGIEELLDLLDEADFLTFRRYEGLDGFYVTKPNMLAAESSDYQYAERVRVLNKAARLVRKEALLQLHRNINMDKVEEELAAIGGFIAAPLEDMANDEEISSGSITIPSGQDILADETLHVILRFVPVGYVREIAVDLGMKNPNA